MRWRRDEAVGTSNRGKDGMAWGRTGRCRQRSGLGVLLCVLLLLPPLAAADAGSAKIVVEGVPADIRDNILSHIGELSAADVEAWRRTRLRLQDRALDALQAQGYYRPTLEISRQQEAVHIAVEPGDAVRVHSLRLEFRGEAGNDIAFTALREQLPLQEGDIFHHGQYEKLKTQVQALASELGYFEARWLQQEVQVQVASGQADIRLIYDSGPRYRFGPVRFLDKNGQAQSLLQERLITRFQSFAEGDPYSADKIIKFNRSLLNSRYFSDVRVHVERDKAVDHAIPIDVVVAADKPSNVDLGIGYSTDIKARISAKWQRPLINEYGHGVEASTELSPIRSSFDAKYNIPLTHPLDDVLQFFYGVKRELVDEVVNWNTVLGVQRQIQKEDGWQRTYSLRWNRDTTESPVYDLGTDTVIGTDTQKADLLLPGISLDRTRVRGGLNPDWGSRQIYQMELASEELLSDTSLVSLRAGWRFLRTYAERHQFLLRGDAGTILTNDFAAVPQSMRFFAGGDQSVRGYGYKSISPRDEFGVAVGGRNLLTGSLEYSYEFIPRWRLAVFSDAGDVFDEVQDASAKIGSGFGVRWATPVGPIRLDFAWAMTEPDRPFRIHFSMGPNL